MTAFRDMEDAWADRQFAESHWNQDEDPEDEEEEGGDE